MAEDQQQEHISSLVPGGISDMILESVIYVPVRNIPVSDKHRCTAIQ